MTPRARLSAHQRQVLEAYVARLTEERRPLPGTRVGEVDAIDWGAVARATGLPKELFFRHLDEAKAILQPHLETFGVEDARPNYDADSIEEAARRYLERLRADSKGLPALPRKKKPHLDWKTIAEEMGVPYGHIETHHHLLRRLFDPATQELGYRLTQAPAEDKPQKVEPFEEAVRGYIDRLRKSGVGVPIRCLRLQPAIDWNVLCEEFDCQRFAKTTRRRGEITRLLMEAAPELGVRYGRESDELLCRLAANLRRSLEEASLDALRGLITSRGRLRWRAIAKLMGEPLETLLPYRMRLRTLVEEHVRKRLEGDRERDEIALITQRVESLVAKMREQNTPPSLLDEAGNLNLKQLAREIRLKTDLLRPHRPWLEPWLRSCISLLFERR